MIGAGLVTNGGTLNVITGIESIPRPNTRTLGTQGPAVTSLGFGCLSHSHIDIYRPARLDPNVPIEETVGAIQELVDAGYVRHIGLSEVGAETIRRAASVAPISDLQIEYSLLSREIEQSGVLAACRELGIGITAYGVLAKGLVAGSTGGIRTMFPRFQGENLEHNQALLAQLTDISEAKGVPLPQLAIAWVAAQGEDIVPIVGARRVEQIESTLASNAVTLNEEELCAIEAAVPAGSALGDRYPAAFMALLDSES